MVIRPLLSERRDWVERFIEERWGASVVVVRGKRYYPAALPGFVAYVEDGPPVGVVTYHLEPLSCQIVTLDAVTPSVGVGTALVKAVRDEATKSRCRKLWVVTTNDNTAALRFYQKRGFVLAALHRNAVHEARRRLKPEIPATGDDGIPIRDELELELML